MLGHGEAPRRDRRSGSRSTVASQAGDEEAVQPAAPGEMARQGAHVARPGELDREAFEFACLDRQALDRQAAGERRARSRPGLPPAAASSWRRSGRRPARAWRPQPRAAAPGAPPCASRRPASCARRCPDGGGSCRWRSTAHRAADDRLSGRPPGKRVGHLDLRGQAGAARDCSSGGPPAGPTARPRSPRRRPPPAARSCRRARRTGRSPCARARPRAGAPAGPRRRPGPTRRPRRSPAGPRSRRRPAHRMAVQPLAAEARRPAVGIGP